MSAVPQVSLRDKMFSFEGRLRRRDYWTISIGLGALIFFVTEAVLLAMFGPEYCIFTGGFQAANKRVEDGLPFVVSTLLGCIAVWPNLAMSAKRRHDRDKGAAPMLVLLVGFWILSYAQIPIMDHYAAEFVTMPFVLGYLVCSLGMLALCIYTFVVVGCLDGTPGPNRFGLSPKAFDLPEG